MTPDMIIYTFFLNKPVKKQQNTNETALESKIFAKYLYTVRVFSEKKRVEIVKFKSRRIQLPKF